MARKLTSETLTDEQIEELAALGMTDQEIRHLVGMADTPFRLSYVESVAKGRARLRQSLRRAQLKSALNGNPSMLIWLGKQYLNQKDASHLEASHEHKTISITPNVLERLQTSYRLTMEQLRVRGGASRRGHRGRGGSRGRDGVLKMTPLYGNGEGSIIAEGEQSEEKE